MGCRKRHIELISIAFLGEILFGMSSNAWASSQITSIDFKGTGGPSEIEIQANGPITFEKQENTQDKQIVLEIQGATISKNNSRKIDTSSFNSKVALISPYQVEGKSDTVRVVIQLRDFVPAQISQDGNHLKIEIPNGTSGEGEKANNLALDSPPAGSLEGSPSSSPSNSPAPLPSSTPQTNLDSYLNSQSTQKFSGKPVTLQVRDADVGDILRMIGETSGFNTIIGDDVKGKLTLSLIDVPWDQALDVILHTMHLGAERKNNILRVITLRNLLDEKTEEQRAQDAAQVNVPRITRVFPISYANLTDLQAILTKFASQSSSSGTSWGNGALGASSSVQAGIVQADNRTNSLVVRDTAEALDKMKKLIELLDTQTAQILIEAKVVEATESFSKSITGAFGLGGTGSSSYVASFAGGNPLDPLIGSPGVFASGSSVSAQSNPSGGTPNGTLGISPSVSFIPGVSQLNAILSWGESENQVKIVSAPKLVVLNKEKASIVEGTPVLVPGSTVVAGVGTVPTSSVQQANVSLNVSPTVTNDGSVLLNLQVSKDVPLPLSGGNQGVGNRSLSTDVLVESGSTLVIGGIYTLQTSHTGAGFPFLRSLPILGALFGSDAESTDRSELFIFVTPRILNVKEAGLNG